ncbi:LuxR C-terminal-related transcriptional regulator [Candidatus Accumulibacter sp. ACC012]|nr:LuxR C-terminal-related transcriptional regulator [Candidatus Accumulibacter sp. ACC012]
MRRMLIADAYALNRLILRLYREGREVPLGSYQAWALEQLQSLLTFDSAWWGNVAADPPALHNVFLHNCDESILREYAPWLEQDFFCAALLASPGVAVNMSDLTTRARYVRTALYRRLGRRFKVEWSLGTLLIEPSSSLHEFLTVWRHDHKRPFSEPERQIKELLMPHLVEMHRAVRLRHFLKTPNGINREWAVVDARGIVHEASPAFIALVSMRWPHWQGSALPEALLSCVRAGQAYLSSELRVDVTSCGELRYLSPRLDGVLAQLSPREGEIATRYATGETYSAIAGSLLLSPATVRNHIAHCFRKLGVNNKAELVRRLEGKA